MIKVRYYSRSGNTKLLAEAIAKGANVRAVSIDEKDSMIYDKTDILFIGGALYAYGLDKKLKDYISRLDAQNIKKAIVFSTSWISKHAIDLLKEALKEKGIEVFENYLYFRNKPTEEELDKARNFVRSIIDNC